MELDRNTVFLYSIPGISILLLETVSDQACRGLAVQGNYADGSLRVSVGARTDALVVYDGDSSSGVTQTGLVPSGVSELYGVTGSNFLPHIDVPIT